MKKYLFLKRHKLDLKSALESQKSTPLWYGSEFRETSVLEPLLKHHPNWNRLKKILVEGSNWELEELSEEDRLSDLQEALERGNHKGATSQPKKLIELVVKDVEYGYALTLPLDRVKNIPGVCLAPMNIAPQNSIDEYGNIIPKDRLTHDQSFKWGSGTSVNSRVKDFSLQACCYGHALRRFINRIIALR